MQYIDVNWTRRGHVYVLPVDGPTVQVGATKLLQYDTTNT